MSVPQDTPVATESNNPTCAKNTRTLSTRKKLLFSGFVTVLFFVGVELLLAAMGVQPITSDSDPFVGFSSYSPLFEKVASADGQAVYRTVEAKLSWFNPQEFPQEKGTDAYRIFCMGGSTTYGRPYNDITSFCGWLREYLKAADSSRNWEVINAGGVSYASYRVAALMDELINYHPDLFIIYTGQNEFLERRTYGQLMDTPSALRETAGFLAHSRVYSSVHSLMNARNNHESQQSGTNLLPEEVDAILDGSVGPNDYVRDENQQNQTIEHFRFNLARIINTARSVGAEVLLVNPAVNERTMSPFKSQHRDGLSADDLTQWQKLITQAKTEREAGKLDEALSSLDRAIEIDPLYAESHFQRGEVLYALNRYPEAKAAFDRAIDEDVCPLRVLSEMHPVITEIAAEYGVPLIDFQKLLESKTETGITGDEWFLDHVHPTIDGYRELGLQLFDELVSQGIVQPGSQWNDETRQHVDELVMGQVDERAHGLALRNLGKVLSWARKYEEAGRLAQLASEKLSDDAEVHCMAGYDFERTGQLEQAKESYEKAIQINPGYAQAHYNLGHVHRKLKEWEFAAQSFQRAVDVDPNYPGGYYNLGLLCEQANQLDRAAECFESSTHVNSQHPGSWEGLGNVRLRQERLDEAIRFLEKAIQLEPRLFSAHNSLGIAYAKLGRMQKAVECFEHSLSIRPQYDPAKQNLERARLKLR